MKKHSTKITRQLQQGCWLLILLLLQRSIVAQVNPPVPATTQQHSASLMGTANTSPYSYTWNNVAAGAYNITAVATDNAGATTTSSAVSVTVNSSNTGTTDKVIVGYWHNWGSTTGSPPYIRLRDVNPKYNVIQVAFGISGTDNATISFTPENITTAEFISDIQYLQSQGRKVLLSLGGQNGTVILGTVAQKQAFVTSMKALLDQYNFDGFDIDVEGGSSLLLDNGDNNFMNPTTVKVVNMIAAIKEIISYRQAQGKDCWLTMAPETYYVQTAYGSNYSPLVGAYLPLIYGLRNELTFIHPQYYNTGSVLGMDNNVYSQATPDFIVAMTEMLLYGFPVAGTGLSFPALREDQVAFGLPAVPAAAPSGGYLAPASVIQALDYLTKGTSFGGQYTLRKPSGYPGLRGIMTWSINWDRTGSDAFANSYYNYFFGNTPGNTPPTVSITSPANNATFTAPATITIQATAADADGIVSKVEFFNGTSLLGTVTAAPYSYTWSNVTNGTYNLTARATDNAGAVTTSSTVTITVGSGGGACNGIAAWSATAVYTNGSQVVYNNKIYQAKWWTQDEQPDINTGDGKPWAYVSDCSGGTGNTPPTVGISSPASGASFTAPANITIQATAADADGTIISVEFYNGTTLLGTVSSAPYTYTWSNVAAGSYTLTAKATDNQGAATTSAAVSITVTGSGGGDVNCTGIATYEPYPKIYNNGDLVVYNNILYESQSDALYNVTPGTADWWWEPLGACSAALRVAGPVTSGLNVNTVKGFEIYPNPVQYELRIISGEKLSGSIIRVFDVAGRQVLVVRPVSNRVDVSRLSPGIYTLVFTNNSSTISKRFIIK